MGSLQVFQLLPIIQKHACKVNQKLVWMWVQMVVCLYVTMAARIGLSKPPLNLSPDPSG